jgi:hypothetical protein
MNIYRETSAFDPWQTFDRSIQRRATLPTNLLWDWLPATFVMVVISVVYYVTNQSDRIGIRLFVSAHGLLGAVVFSAAIATWVAKLSSVSLVWPFTLLFVLPVASMLVSLVSHRGSKLVHLLLVPELMCLAWAWFVGGMAITSDWL